MLGLLFCLAGLPVAAVAQTHRTCATVEVNAGRNAGRLHAEREAAFEQWLRARIEAKKPGAGQRTAATVYTIPVVVHVVHNGEAEGTGTNISAAQVTSQIQILNEDYRRRQGTRGYNTSPVGADAAIEFRLAARDPDGFPATGIVRVRGTQRAWNIEDETALKSLSYWPAEQYLNIWVCNLEDETLGFAQLPESNRLPGVPAPGQTNPRLDGVVIGHRYFGEGGATLASGNDFRYGRTTTHEVGHFLGLRHIWGDPPAPEQGCAYDDYCQDTPNTRQPNYDCPQGDSTTCITPRQREMVENYMDYTDDACMNLFTREQVLRMRTVLENSPRRVSLPTSPGLLPVTLLPNNARIAGVLGPDSVLCSGNFTPVVVLRNYGGNPLTQVILRYGVGGQPEREYTWTGSLATAQRDTVALPAIGVTPGRYTFTVAVVGANGTTDSDPLGDAARVPFRVLTVREIPFWANFNRTLLPRDWVVANEDNGVTWRDTVVSSNLSGSAPDQPNRVAYLNYSGSPASAGRDALLTGAYDISGAGSAYLLFDVAYARRQTAEDGLAVAVSTNCGATFAPENVVYQKTGSQLATVTTGVAAGWAPTQAGQWRTETISLSRYASQGQVRFAFIGIAGGNNLYVDNIRLVRRPETTEEEVVGFRSLTQAFRVYPNPSRGQVTLRFFVYEPVDVEVRVYTALGQPFFAQTFPQAEEEYQVTLPALPAGVYFVTAAGPEERVTRKIVIAP